MKHREGIETRLFARIETLFGLEASVTLYDLTNTYFEGCLLYTSDAADERSSVDLGGRRIIKKTNSDEH